MKKYYIYSTLSFAFISFLVEILMSNHAGFTTFTDFNWFISSQILSITHIITWIIQGVALSFAAFLYISPKEALSGGLRFGLITGIAFSLLVLFNMMFQIDNIAYSFMANSLLPLTGLTILGFTISGWVFGLMIEIFSPEFPTNKSLWTLA